MRYEAIAEMLHDIVINPLTACNTMQGAGRDVEKVGQKVQEEAVGHKKY